MDIVDKKDVALLGRSKNGVVLKYNKSIIITTDILKWNDEREEPPSITLDDISEKINVFASEILLDSKNSRRDPESIVYGETLVELLKWIITVLKTHKHGPNAAPVPDFFQEANSRYDNMNVNLLNKQVKSR